MILWLALISHTCLIKAANLNSENELHSEVDPAKGQNQAARQFEFASKPGQDTKLAAELSLLRRQKLRGSLAQHGQVEAGRPRRETDLEMITNE